MMERINPNRNQYWCQNRHSRDFWIGFLKKVNGFNSQYKFTMFELLHLVKELYSVHGNGVFVPDHCLDVTNAYSDNLPDFGRLIVHNFSSWADYTLPVTAGLTNDPTSLITSITETGGSSGSKKSKYSNEVDDAVYELRSFEELPNTTLFKALRKLHGVQLAWFSDATRSEQLEWLTYITPRKNMSELVIETMLRLMMRMI